MPITAQQLAAAAVCPIKRAEAWVAPISAAMERFDISTPARASAFVAQISFESARLARVEENLNYDAEGLMRVFWSRFTAAEAAAYAHHPERIANRVYANRIGNGDEASGDGWRYRGRGLIQITGRSNYAACGLALGVDLVAKPESLLQPDMAALSAAWFWEIRGLNELADAGDFATITRRINGALTGQAGRFALWNGAKAALA